MWVNGVHGPNVLLDVIEITKILLVFRSVIGLHLERLRMVVRRVCMM